MESLNIQVVTVLLPLNIKHYKMPYLKALTRSIEHASEQGRGSTFIYQN